MQKSRVQNQYEKALEADVRDAADATNRMIAIVGKMTLRSGKKTFFTTWCKKHRQAMPGKVKPYTLPEKLPAIRSVIVCCLYLERAWSTDSYTKPEDPEKLIEVEGLGKVYGSGEARVEALAGVSLGVRAGTWVSVVGASGSGKSTLMNVIGMLDRPTSGSYRLGGRDVSGLGGRELARIRRETIGFIFQGYNLLPRQDARRNVELPMIYDNVGAKERRWRATGALERVGLGDRLHHRPSELSGGQQQRVAIARALVNEPALILADEPTGNLDSVSGGSILELFGELRSSGVTLIVVTHEPDVAEYAGRVIELRDGCVISDGAPGSTDEKPADPDSGR